MKRGDLTANMVDFDSLWNELNTARKQEGLTWEKMEFTLGNSQYAVRQAFRRKTLSLQTYIRIVDWLGYEIPFHIAH